MIIVIIAGGSGTRLWPLSQSNYPKHLLKLTGEKSLLQNTVERARRISDSVYVITEKSHAAEVELQLSDLPKDHLIIEPGRRGTANCFALALAYLADRHPTDEPIAFLHADSHITDQRAFADSVVAAAAASARHGRVCLMGLEPTYAATGFGYIHRGAPVDPDAGVYEVRAYKEKPDAATAREFLKSGEYLWNTGQFAAPLAIWQQEFKRYAPKLADAFERLQTVLGDPAKLSELYLNLETDQIDYAFSERSPNLLVAAARFDWVDIGSFFDLHKILQDADQNTLKGDVELVECEDVMIHSDGKKPIVAIGLSGVVVVDSPDGLLVCAKEKSQLVGDAAKKLAKRKRSHS